MSSGICSQGLVLATAMVVSSTVIFLTFSRQKTLSPPPKQTLRSCLPSDGKKRVKKRKKKVQFAENVKETSGDGQEYRKEQHKKLIAAASRRRRKMDGFCRSEMPANRIALYNGILRDRVHVHKMECSY
ncbi:hypothetical protein ES319_D10G083000v1 [Gossypium barbadense]|uniref:Uncharacterized protein n=2 Tax=Gossypium TaxID=3633 RepID=A0A5J5PRW6_GOSBA|nr:hypothetical protein ES319_D10G083000v1 [Gossypium barbadense]PPD87760.1 hypothetical protein GOBAR_DD15304 [Gossypium barbadense]TYG49353.1 hypothetical protein ES288_D10G087800v1 [Gossypium darwinii]